MFSRRRAVKNSIPWIYSAAVASYGVTLNVLPGETACLAQWHAGDVVVSAVLEDSHSVPASALHLGLADATHASAAGKLLLALAPSEHVERYLEAHDLAHRSCAAVPDALRAELDRVRAAGYAVG